MRILWDEYAAEQRELKHIGGATINNNLVAVKKRHPFEVAIGIAWDENEAEQRELEHIGGATINNNLVTVKKGFI